MRIDIVRLADLRAWFVWYPGLGSHSEYEAAMESATFFVLKQPSQGAARLEEQLQHVQCFRW